MSKYGVFSGPYFDTFHAVRELDKRTGTGKEITHSNRVIDKSRRHKHIATKMYINDLLQTYI